MLKAAAREGLVTLPDDSKLQFTAQGRAAALYLLGLRLMVDLRTAARLHQELQDGCAPDPA